jgi:hypothetical protein
MAPHLRVFKESADSDKDIIQAPTVRVRLSDLLPLIVAAQRKNFTWVQDFMEDEVAVTADLYEVLRSFRTFRPAS